MTTIAAPPALETIPFNRSYVSGRELEYLTQAINSGNWVGGGPFTARCEALLAQRLATPRVLLTTSCTDAMELAALVMGIKPGDEVILPSYTFSSTANAFALRGAELRFADSCADHPNLDPAHVRELITPRTRCVVVVHYAGMSCDMDAIADIVAGKDIAVLEDAAQGIDAFYRSQPLGTLGRFGALSFHGTKNIAAGECGALILKSAEDIERAEIIREKGTNRSAFVRGEVDKYGWVELGSSFIPSDLLAAVLLAQLEAMDEIQSRRVAIWQRYHEALAPLEEAGVVQRPHIPRHASNNAHMYYLLCRSEAERDGLLEHLRMHGIRAAFHYTPLHNSPYQSSRAESVSLPNAERFHESLIRLPLYADLREADIKRVVSGVYSFFRVSAHG